MLIISVALLTVFAGTALGQYPPGFTTQVGPPSFLGCYAAATPQSTVQPGTFTFLGCSSQCKTQSNRYFFWNPDTQGCACALTAWSSPSSLLTGSVTAGCTATNQSPPGCQSCPFNTWQYWDSETSFVTGVTTCYNQPNINIALGSYNVISNPGQCYVQCATSTYAYVYANIVFNQWNCFCSDTNLINNGAPGVGCQQGSVFVSLHSLTTLTFSKVFAHSLQSRASGLSRRRRATLSPNAYCPGALSACKVSGSEGYEVSIMYQHN
ncbi:uncharacterized protein LOC62_02G003513 [Vanrija pseudolonga]|uniref:WSC domain-containing protein n=1 Tax=Vanrija pseudolonga TaxID=143232 RepID=A0AAF0Y488_9TREE|nr:hypothetical protein LOC62_02G003513 [Vanrija pseudolonga]